MILKKNPILNQNELDIGLKVRSNPLAWKGQFSPQLVEVHLRAYAEAGYCILDPFAGSGTVLLESLRLGLKSIGVEINPAAISLARIYAIAKLPLKVRSDVLNAVESCLENNYPANDLPLFCLDASSSLGYDKFQETDVASVLVALLGRFPQPSVERDLIESLIVLVDLSTNPTWMRVKGKWREIRCLIDSLPYSDIAPSVYLGDARQLPIPDQSIDLVFTSPPYINVFNYHQQYRLSAEAIGWGVLPFARCEIGANRKFRGNRLFTVIQYCIDMSLVFREVARVLKQEGRAIFVVGRESNVRKTPFYNASILESIAIHTAGFGLVLKQERMFCNRFGQKIYEDILHFQRDVPMPEEVNAISEARLIARNVLSEAYERTTDTEVLADILVALDSINKIEASGFLIKESLEIVPAHLHILTPQYA